MLALHDWKTYGEMRNLARENFGLELGSSYLPMGTLDQGLDVLQPVPQRFLRRIFTDWGLRVWL